MSGIKVQSKTTFYVISAAIIYLLASQFKKFHRSQMTTFIQNIEDTFNSGDPEVRKWFLVRHNYLPFLLCGSYAVFSWSIGPAIMRKRKPFELRTVMVLFNFFLVSIYTYALIIAVLYLPSIPRHQFCRGGLTVKKGDITYMLTRTGWVVYLLKYIEFFDTVFFILRKKENQITFLHVMHHTLVPICGWMIFRTERTGVQAVPGIINAIVHVIMYSYYGLAAMGPGVRKYLWWKKYLTLLQMVQFCAIILFVGVLTPYFGCKMVLSSYVMDIVLATLFLYLFYQFYKASFLTKDKSIEKNGTVKNGSLTNGALKNGTVENHIYSNGGHKVEASTNGSLKNGVVENHIYSNGGHKVEASTNGSLKNGAVENHIYSNGGHKIEGSTNETIKKQK